MTAVTIVTQTRVAEGGEEAFARFQAAISAAIAGAPGFIEQSMMPPNPPVQFDWVILQRFHGAGDATAWLHSQTRQRLVAGVQPNLTGADDVHLVHDAAAGVLPSPVSIVITTRVKPGAEAAFRQWEQRIAQAQARAPGFQGYRFEPPIPGVQDGYMAILRFDSEASLQGWMSSPERQALLAEAEAFTAEVRTRVVQAGFAQWFATPGAGGPPAWKMNMLVLLMLYPVVFLFGLLVQTPLLMRAWGFPFWLALFVGNVAGVVLLNWLVPWAGRRFGWWLAPGVSAKANWGGVAALAGLYGVLMAVFSRL